MGLITLRSDLIGELSCNPAVGGLGKGHLVREIDALDGLIARVADAAGLQFRLLNRSKGPAVRGPRVQTDRAVYKRAMQSELRSIANLSIVEGEVVDLTISRAQIVGVVLADGRIIRSENIILTTGTFLGGVIHIGDRCVKARRRSSFQP